MAYVFGKKVSSKEGYLIENCKVGFKVCPLHKMKCDSGCASCRCYDSKFWSGEDIGKAKLTYADVCYLRQSGDKCPKGYKEFINNGVCKQCIHYMRETLGINRIEEKT